MFCDIFVPDNSHVLHIQVTVVYPVMKVTDPEHEESFDVRQFRDAAMSVLAMTTDICSSIIIKQQMTFHLLDITGTEQTETNGTIVMSLFTSLTVSHLAISRKAKVKVLVVITNSYSH